MENIAIVFDIDGLMVDTEPISRLAWDKALAPFNHELDDELHTRIVGYRIDESALMVIEEYDLPLTPEALIELKRIEYDQVLSEGIPVMSGLFDLIEAVNQRKISWAVATSSPLAHAQKILGLLELTDSCAAMTGGDEVSKGKPAPDIYLLAAERLGLPPANCLAIEDSAPGCRAALTAGMMTLAVPNSDTEKSNFPPIYQTYKSLNGITRALDTLLSTLKNRSS